MGIYIPAGITTSDIGSISGTGADNRIPTFTDATNIQGESNLTFDGSTLDVNGALVVDGSNISLDSTSTLNIDNSNTSNGIGIGTNSSGTPISIGHTTSEVTVNDNFTVTGTTDINNVVAIGDGGGTPASNIGLTVDHNSTSAYPRLLNVGNGASAIVVNSGGNVELLQVYPASTVVNASVTAAHVYTASFYEPRIDVSATSAVVTTAATVYIEGAATEATSNYALWVDSGETRLDGPITTYGDVHIKGTTPALTIGDGDDETNLLLFDGSDSDYQLNHSSSGKFYIQAKKHSTANSGGSYVNSIILSADALAAYHLDFAAAHTSDGSIDQAALFAVSGDITGANGDTDFISLVAMGEEVGASVTTQNNSETIGVASTLHLSEPNLTANDTVTNAATLYIQNAPTEATNDYALFVDDGNSRFDGQVYIRPANGTTDYSSIEIGQGRTGGTGGDSYVDLVGDATYDDYGARFIRFAGVNGNCGLYWRGTGAFYINANEAGPFIVNTAATERQRIDGAGNITFNNNETFYILSGTSNRPIVKIHNSNADNFPPYFQFMKASASPANNDYLGTMQWWGNNGSGTAHEMAAIYSQVIDVSDDSTNQEDARLVMSVIINGVLSEVISTSAAVVSGDFNDTSDVMLKDNIEDIDTAIDTVKQLRPVTFDWKLDDREASGFIAQEVERIIPNIVTGKDATEDGGRDEHKSIKTIGLLAQVTKALQESIEKIETLEAQVKELQEA